MCWELVFILHNFYFTKRKIEALICIDWWYLKLNGTRQGCLVWTSGRNFLKNFVCHTEHWAAGGRTHTWNFVSGLICLLHWPVETVAEPNDNECQKLDLVAKPLEHQILVLINYGAPGNRTSAVSHASKMEAVNTHCHLWIRWSCWWSDLQVEFNLMVGDMPWLMWEYPQVEENIQGVWKSWMHWIFRVAKGSIILVIAHVKSLGKSMVLCLLGTDCVLYQCFSKCAW